MSDIERKAVVVDNREFEDWRFLLNDFDNKISNSVYDIGDLVCLSSSVGCIFGKKYSVESGRWAYQLESDGLWVAECDIDGLAEIHRIEVLP